MRDENGLTRRRLLIGGGAGLFLGAMSGDASCAADDRPALRTFEAEWAATVPPSSGGYGVALVPEGAGADRIADWVEPSAPGVLAVGFDTSNPKSDKPFGPDGNIYGRPEREVSLHWDGVEIANRLCPVELRPGHKAKWRVAPTPGGAEVSVWVNGRAVYDRFFVPGVTFQVGRARFAAGGDAERANVRDRFTGPAVPLPAPRRVVALDAVTNDAKNHRQTAEVAFPDTLDGVGRVVCTLTLGPTPAGLDPWDRIAQIFVYDEKGERFELLRYMTPYRKGWTWHADVTDLMPLLTGKRKVEMFCETWGAGWLVSVAFDFYPGQLKRRPYKVVNLWNGTAVIGQADKPVSAFFTPKTLAIPAEAKAVRARLCVTGHGQAPNTDNAAEFIPLWRRLHANGKSWQDTLWKTDVYLNPCRPQSGTWKFDRAGWAPGDLVTPWTVDVTSAVKPGADATFRYEIQPFENKTPDQGNPARHLVESQVIFYK
jgi:hypothetical protein